MNELKTLQEEGDKALDLRFTNLGREDEGLTILTLNEVQTKLKPFIQQERQKSFTLGIQKGIELVEGVVPQDKIEKFTIHTRDYIATSTTGISEFENTGFNTCRSQILESIYKLKQDNK